MNLVLRQVAGFFDDELLLKLQTREGLGLARIAPADAPGEGALLSDNELRALERRRKELQS